MDPYSLGTSKRIHGLGCESAASRLEARTIGRPWVPMMTSFKAMSSLMTQG